MYEYYLYFNRLLGVTLMPAYTVPILTRGGHTNMQFSISPEDNPECDENIRDIQSSRYVYTMTTDGYTMASEPKVRAIGRTHEFNESDKKATRLPDTLR